MHFWFDCLFSITLSCRITISDISVILMIIIQPLFIWSHPLFIWPLHITFSSKITISNIPLFFIILIHHLFHHISPLNFRIRFPTAIKLERAHRFRIFRRYHFMAFPTDIFSSIRIGIIYLVTIWMFSSSWIYLLSVIDIICTHSRFIFFSHWNHTCALIDAELKRSQRFAIP
jgi:hypothetical protein